jgi:hypothetical protein
MGLVGLTGFEEGMLLPRLSLLALLFLHLHRLVNRCDCPTVAFCAFTNKQGDPTAWLTTVANLFQVRQ